LAFDQTVTLHPGEHTRQAGSEQKRLFSYSAGFHSAVVGVLTQYPQHPPLLVGQAMRSQAGPGVTHDRFARLQEQARQVAVDEWRGLHLFNMLIEWSGFNLGVFPCFFIEGDKGRCLAVGLR
jgi:hypothetical protein